MNADAWGQLVRVVEILVVPFVLWVVKTLTAIQREVSDLKTVLIGIDGKNGIRSRVIRVERRVERLSAAQVHRHGEDASDDDE